MNPRPLKLRRGARVLLLAGEEVLLLNDSDPGVPGSSWWVTPGGGIDDGENPAEAACREAGEETGLRLTPFDLVGPVARGRACHGYSDRIRVQDDLFFLARVRRFEPSNMGWTDSEKKRMRGFRWWRIDSLPEEVWPPWVSEIAMADPAHPLALADREESTVPLSPAEWERVSAALG